MLSYYHTALINRTLLGTGSPPLFHHVSEREHSSRTGSGVCVPPAKPRAQGRTLRLVIVVWFVALVD